MKHRKACGLAVMAALFGMPALASAALDVENNTASLADDAGVSQAEVRAGNAWFDSDANSDGYQNRSQLKTGNALGGQAQAQGSLAAGQSLAATDPGIRAAIAQYLGLYQGYYREYLGYLDDANAASSQYSACVAAGGKACLDRSGYYNGLAQQAYGQYQYYYGLWNQDVQQQQAMLATGGQQAVLSGSSAQSSQASYGDYQNDQAAANAAAQASASATQSGNSGNDASADQSGAQAAQQALAQVQRQTGVQQGQQVTVPTESGPGFTPAQSALQDQMDTLTQQATQNAQTAVLQGQYAANRAAAADTATAQAQADGQAAAVAPTPESGAMWRAGQAMAAGTASAYQSDANATMAASLAAQQGFVAEQNQANADALTLAQQQDQAAQDYADQAAQKAGVTLTAPVASNGTMTALANAQNTIDAAQTTAETDAMNAYAAQRQAVDAQSNAGTDLQQSQADAANAQAAEKVSPTLGKTWSSMAGSYGQSAAAETATANAASAAESADLSAGNAAEQQAQAAAGDTGVNGMADAQGASAAQQALAQIEKRTGVPQGAHG
ncbi:hypothetical protein [Acidithiobacillus sp.]|uniref:hypothetical protein n=1 Tax=Acidithiobacillus sp. TaxID=1872118 RepID=UPI003D047061